MEKTNKRLVDPVQVCESDFGIKHRWITKFLKILRLGNWEFTFKVTKKEYYLPERVCSGCLGRNGCLCALKQKNGKN